MKFGFFVGVLTGMFCILGPIVTFIAGVFVGYKAFSDDDTPTESPVNYHGGEPTVNYQGMAQEKEPTA